MKGITRNYEKRRRKYRFAFQFRSNNNVIIHQRKATQIDSLLQISVHCMKRRRTAMTLWKVSMCHRQRENGILKSAKLTGFTVPKYPKDVD